MSIPRRILGKTGLSVSALSLGTVALGVDYGIGASGRLAHEAALALLRAAFDGGVTLFDTAPNYGDAESLLGAALAHQEDAIFATKLSLPGDISGTAALRAALRKSVDRSRTALRRDVIDILQIHNLSAAQAADPALGAAMAELRAQGLVRCVGASVYSEDEALTALHAGWVDVLQVAYNVLDQRMASRVFDTASALNVGLLTRSAYLKGALTPRVRQLPPQLAELRAAVETLASDWAIPLDALPDTALAFCLGEPRIGSVLIGPSRGDELAQALRGLDFARAGQVHARGLPYALNNPALVDPRLWSLP